jgi:hypothetical protein
VFKDTIENQYMETTYPSFSLSIAELAKYKKQKTNGWRKYIRLSNTLPDSMLR